MMISEANAAFLADRRQRDCMTLTLRFYAAQLRYFSRWLAVHGRTEVEQIALTDAADYVADMKTRQRRRRGGMLSAVTVRKSAMAIRTLLLWMHRSGMTTENLGRLVPVPRARTRLPKAITVQEARKLLAGTLSERDQAIVCLLLDTGLRQSEVCMLDVGDVDMQAGTILVRRGKGAKQRMVVFASKARNALSRWLAVRRRLNLCDEPALFVSRTHARLTPSGLDKMIRQLAKRTGVHVSTHMLRHTFATLYLDRGGQIQDLADLLGHEHIATTMIYNHTTTASLRRKHRGASPLNRVRN